jgi:hypothetical protein
MNTEKVQPAFNNLIELIQSLIKTRKANGLSTPSSLLVEKCAVIGHVKTNTGISVTHSEQSFIQKEEWGRASYQILDLVVQSPQFQQLLCIIPVSESQRPPAKPEA